jgi:hypothetical protein
MPAHHAEDVSRRHLQGWAADGGRQLPDVDPQPRVVLTRFGVMCGLAYWVPAQPRRAKASAHPSGSPSFVSEQPRPSAQRAALATSSATRSPSGGQLVSPGLGDGDRASSVDDRDRPVPDERYGMMMTQSWIVGIARQATRMGPTRKAGPHLPDATIHIATQNRATSRDCRTARETTDLELAPGGR